MFIAEAPGDGKTHFAESVPDVVRDIEDLTHWWPRVWLTSTVMTFVLMMLLMNVMVLAWECGENILMFFFSCCHIVAPGVTLSPIPLSGICHQGLPRQP